MAATKPPYAPQFREQMVELYRVGRKASALAKEFGCSEQSILNWVARAAAGIPVEQPTRIVLAINRKTAKAPGVTLPQPLLLRADCTVE